MMLMLALPPETARYIVVLDFALMLFCGVAVREAYKDVVPKFLSALALLFGMAYVLVAVAVVINLLSPLPPTPGVKFLSVPLTALAIVVTSASAWAFLRHRTT